MSKSLTMMKDPGSWPAWPFLPLRRGNPLILGNQGVLLELSTTPYTVYLINLFQISGGDFVTEDTPKEEYNNFEEILAAGWEVD